PIVARLSGSCTQKVSPAWLSSGTAQVIRTSTEPPYAADSWVMSTPVMAPGMSAAAAGVMGTSAATSARTAASSAAHGGCATRWRRHVVSAWVSPLCDGVSRPRHRAPGVTVEKETPDAVRHDAASAVVCITPADTPTPTTPHGRTVVGREVGRRQPRGVPTSRVARRGPRRRPLDGAGPPLVGRAPAPDPARAGWEPCPVVDVHTAALPPPALPPRPRLRLRPPPCPEPPWPEPRRSSGRPGCRPPPRRGPRAAGSPRPAGATVGAGV